MESRRREKKPARSRTVALGRKASAHNAGAFRFGLSGQVALVTGAAGQLGRQFSTTLGVAGATVVLGDVNVQACREFEKTLKAQGIHAVSLQVDVSDQKSVKAAFDRLGDELGHVDILVNNAGIAVFSSFEERTFEEFMRVLQVNVGGTFLCTQSAVKLMKHRPTGGRIINIGSIYGVVSGDPRIYTDSSRNTSEVYAASKAAVVQMTRYWAVHLAKYNIRVNAISPGGVFNNQGQDFVKHYSYRTPLGRMANENELNEVLLLLASEASSYITGHNLIVDGGWTAW